MALVQLCFSCFLLFLAFGAAGSFIIFSVDVIKWHKKEERVKVVPSAQELPDELLKESEVKEDVEQSQRSDNGNGGSDSDTSAADAAELRQPDTSTFFDTWL